MSSQPVADSRRSSDALLQVSNLRTYYYARCGTVKAVDGVSFAVERGDAIGVAGESGSGKSTLGLSIIRGVSAPGRIIDGKILFNDQDLLSLSEREMKEIRWKEISMVFQGAMNAFNPMFTIGRQIAEAIRLHEAVTDSEVRDRIGELFDAVRLERSRLDDHPHELSGGMRQRAMIAMALACNPSLVVMDEPTTALDVVVQAQVLQLIDGLQDALGLTLMLITHDLSVIAEVCDKVAVMYGGHLVELGPTEAVFLDPLHPYSYALSRCVPRIDGPRTFPASIPGHPPNLALELSGCKFHLRCKYAQGQCQNAEPAWRELRPGHFVACHFADELELRCVGE